MKKARSIHIKIRDVGGLTEYSCVKSAFNEGPSEQMLATAHIAIHTLLATESAEPDEFTRRHVLAVLRDFGLTSVVAYQQGRNELRNPTTPDDCKALLDALIKAARTEQP